MYAIPHNYIIYTTLQYNEINYHVCIINLSHLLLRITTDNFKTTNLLRIGMNIKNISDYLHTMSYIFITGTTSGIGNEIANILSQSNTVVCGNRNGDPPLDMSCMKSIDAFLEYHKSKTFDIVILNAGTKATRKLVEWNGKWLNQCRVVNLIANDYILSEMRKRNMIAVNAKLVFVSSITHWTAQDNPCPSTTDTDPTDAIWANLQYPNTKLGLFFLAKKMKQINSKYDIIVINPGMVSTNIFGDKNAEGLLASSIRNVREFLSFTPHESASYMVKSILSDNADQSKEFRYFTPHQTVGVLGYFEKTQILQDIIGKRLLQRRETDTDNYSKRVQDKSIEENYNRYMSV
jgi:short-subunit dehydrogenase